VKRFDINACFGHWPFWELRHKTADDLIAHMDRNGIDRAAVISLRGLLADWRAGNEETLAAAERYPARLVPTATVSPFRHGDGAELKRLVAAGMRAVRLVPTFHNYQLDDEFVDDICRAAASCGIPVMIATRPMMNWRFQPVPLETIRAVTERHAGTTFLLSGPNYLVEFQALVRIMAQCDNVVVEISCLQGFGAVARLVREVGADRVLFGTGAVLHYAGCNVAKLDHAEIADQQRRAIAAENACRLLGLPT
jgi:predicted TIM-barrel fold metal-dependent hydrolase